MASESRPSVPDLLARETRRRPSVQLGRRLAYGELDGPWDEPGSGAFEELSSIPTPRHRDRGTSSPFRLLSMHTTTEGYRTIAKCRSCMKGGSRSWK